MSLQGKKILLISVSFFGYEKAIIQHLETLGAKVIFYDDRPSNAPLMKGLIRLNKKWLSRKIDAYYRNIFRAVSEHSFDFFLLIKGEAIPSWFISAIQAQNPTMQSIAYTYDSVKEHGYFKKLSTLFNKVFTFDPADALANGWHFRPLFFLDEYRKTPASKAPAWDLVFLGTAHTDRYIIGEKVRQYTSSKALRTFFYYYAPSPLTFKIRRIFDKHLQTFDIKKLSFQALSHKQIIDIYAQTYAVLDINKPYQKGLTMRTFEVLASGKKLITFNTDIAQYPFYNPQNILILHRENPEMSFPASFFETPFVEIPTEHLHKMSLHSWLECLFIQPQDEYWLTTYSL